MILGLGPEMEEALSKDIIFIRKYVLSSWERCINSGLLPEDMPRLIEVSDQELDDLINHNQSLIDTAQVFIKKIKSTIPCKKKHHNTLQQRMCYIL